LFFKQVAKENYQFHLIYGLIMNYFKGKNIILRALEPSDLEWLFRLENDESLWHLSDTNQPFSKYILEQYIQNAKLDIYEAKQMRLVIEAENSAVGLIDLFDFDPFHKRVGIGIILIKEYQNRGFGTEALQLIVSFCFEYLKIHSLFANIAFNNLPSLKLFQSLDFQITGTKKEWHFNSNKYKDEHFLQLINSNEV